MATLTDSQVNDTRSPGRRDGLLPQRWLSLCAALCLLGCRTTLNVPAAELPWIEQDSAVRDERTFALLGVEPRTVRLGEAVVRFIDVSPPGETTKRPVLFVHGFGGSIGDFGPILAREAIHRRVLALDLPGFGSSQLTGGIESMQTFVQIVRRFLRASGVTSVHLVGHSLGGQICLALCLDEPSIVSSLVLIDTAGTYDPTEFVRRVSKRYGRINVGDISTKRDRSLFDVIRGDGRGMLFSRIVSDDPATCATLASFSDNLRHRVRALRVPTIIVWGEQDPLFEVENAFFLKENIEGARLYVIEGAGHVPQLTHESLVDQYLQEHFARNEAVQ